MRIWFAGWVERAIRRPLRAMGASMLQLSAGAETRARRFDQRRQESSPDLDASGMAIAPVIVMSPAHLGMLALRLQLQPTRSGVRSVAILPISVTWML